MNPFKFQKSWIRPCSLILFFVCVQTAKARMRLSRIAVALEPSPSPMQKLPKKYGIVKNRFEPQREISNNVVWSTSKGSDQPVHIRSLLRASPSRLNIL